MGGFVESRRSGEKRNRVGREFVSSWSPRLKIAREGWLPVGLLLGVAGLLRGLAERTENRRVKYVLRLMGNISFNLGLLTAYAYRDPYREPLGNAPDYFYSPVDGKILAVERVEEPLYLQGPAYRIKISSHVMDVPVQRTPMAGQVRYVHREEGEGEGEPLKVGLETDRGLPLLLTYQPDNDVKVRLPGRQGLSLWVEAGQSLYTVERLGVRGLGVPLLTTLYLPVEGVDVLGMVGQHVQAGMTIVGRVKPA